MRFNIDKRKVIHFGAINVHGMYTLNRLPLGKSTMEKDLEVTMDNKLNYSSQSLLTRLWEMIIRFHRKKKCCCPHEPITAQSTIGYCDWWLWAIKTISLLDTFHACPS